MIPLFHTETFSIASGTSASAVKDLGQFRIFAIQTPSALSATNMHIRSAYSSTDTMLPVYNDTGSVSAFSVGANRVIALDSVAGSYAALRFLQFVGDADEIDDRTFTLILKR